MKIIDQIIQDHPRLETIMRARDAKGIETYGGSLEVDTCSTEELLQHLREEVADAVVYATALYSQLGEASEWAIEPVLFDLIACALEMVEPAKDAAEVIE